MSDDKPIDYASKTDEELDAIIKSEYPSSDTGFGAIAERHRREIKKPHRPSFWLLVASVILSFLALCVALFALPQVQQLVAVTRSPLPSNKPVAESYSSSLPPSPHSQIPPAGKSKK